MPDENIENPDDSMVYENLTEVEELCERYVALYREDKAPSIEKFAAQFPSLETEILELLPTIVMMEGARSRSFAKRKDGSVTRGSERADELGEYKIIQEIGRGGMGIVYEANQRSLNRRVAIKLLPKHMLSDEQVERFYREASTAAKLHHTNIAPIYGVGESSGFHFYAMQLLNGVTLDRYVASGSNTDDKPVEPLSINQVVEMGEQVALALQYAHDQGVLHRDIKPSNLLLDSGGNVWMTDFGLAISREHQSEHAISASGTLRYMAPEKFNDELGDETGDIYSLGITLIELLSGRPAFGGARLSELTNEIKSGKCLPLNYQGKALPSDLEAVLRKSISIDSANRYPTARDFASDLRRFFETRPVTAKRDSSFGNAYRWFKRNKALAAACAVATTMLITTSVVSLFSYFNVQDALNAEHDQRVRAQHSSTIASLAMDRMFDQISGGAMPFDDQLQSEHPAPPLRRESAALAKQLSDFYSQLASQKGKSSDLTVKALVARTRVGELNARLGQYDDAAEALRIAMRGYESLVVSGQLAQSDEYIILISRLANQLGMVKKLAGDSQSAAIDHDNAISRLTDRLETSPAPNPRLTLELAKSYYYSVRETRPGMGPNSFPLETFSAIAKREALLAEQAIVLSPTSVNRLEEAVGLLNGIESTDDQELVDSAKHLRALCYRELVNDVLSKRSNAEIEYHRKAVVLLEELLEKNPNRSNIKFELMRTLAEANVFDLDLDLDSINQALESLIRARTYGDDLGSDYPQVENYRVELIHCHFKIGQLAAKKQLLVSGPIQSTPIEELEELKVYSFRRAIKEQTVLTRTNPDSLAYKVWTARFVMSLASCRSIQADIEDRDRLIGRATAILNRLPDQVLQKPEVDIMVREAKQMARQALMNPGL